MNGKQYAELIGVPHGTVKRWLHEGMPANRSLARNIDIDFDKANAWVQAHRAGSIAFKRESSIYFAKRDDGAVKIGWSSDVIRRMFELRKATRQNVRLVACFPGPMSAEDRLHKRFANDALGEEWFRGPAIDEYLATIGFGVDGEV